MTIGAIVSVVIGVLVLIGGLILGIWSLRDEVGGGIAVIVISVILAAFNCHTFYLYANRDRQTKSQKSKE